MISTLSERMSGVSVFVSHLLNWHAFGVLALLPGAIAILNLIPAGLNFDKTKKEVSSMRLDETRRTGKKLRPMLMQVRQGIDNYRPRVPYTLLGAFLLTAVFEVVAAIGGTGYLQYQDFGVTASRPGTPGAASGQKGEESVKPPKSAGGAVVAPKPGAQKPVKPGAVGGDQGDQRAGTAKDKPTVNGLDGLVYAGYGAFIYTLILVISRLNSSAMTGKFLAVSAVRSAIALVLGFTAADTNIFSGLTPNQGLFVLFFIGLFPSWAMDALRSKAQEIFKPPTGGCDVLPICLIDGLDDGIADRLAEIGVWDIQHIAAGDLGVLAVTTTYPVRRIVDWMDQAILISYVRGLIVHFRAVGVRGAIDFAVLYRDEMGFDYEIQDISNSAAVEAYRKKLADRATEIIKALAQKSGLSEAALRAIGRSLYEDSVVNFLWNLWFDIDATAKDNKKDDKKDAAGNDPNPAGGTPTITVSDLPEGTVGAPYSGKLVATGAKGAVTWSLTQGALPPGLKLTADGVMGVISGIPTTAGPFTFTVGAADQGPEAILEITITIKAAS